MKYVLLRSWHIVKGENLTLCGREYPAKATQTDGGLPLDGKSCETCLRIAEHKR